MSQKIRHSLGPSIIIAAAVVGTGELVIAPRLGATVGMSALWLIVLGCVIKVFLQEEIGRHTILTGDSTLQNDENDDRDKQHGNPCAADTAAKQQAAARPAFYRLVCRI